jgi:ABC-type multidrug transport system fused ATPase/permease subunit
MKKNQKLTKKPTINLFYLARQSPWLFLAHYGFALFSAYGSTQLIFGYLGEALKKGGVETLKANIGSFLLRLIIYGITVYLHILIGRYLEEFYTAHLRKKLTKKFLSANFTQTQKEEFILSRFDNDTATVGRLAVDIFNRSFYSVCSIILLFWGLGKEADEKWLIPWCLGALAILAILVPVLYYLSYRYKLKRDREFEKENKRFKELRDNIEYIKTTGAENKEIKQSNQQFTNNLRKNYAFIATKSIYATIPSYILVRFIPFLFLVMSGQVSGAVLYAKLSSMFDACKTIFEMFWAYGGYESYSSSCQRLSETFANLEKKQTSLPVLQPLPTKKADITFQKVDFSYSETNSQVLHNFTFNFQSGKKYALLGPNGIGKSTLFKLLVKLYQPQQGNIKLDNVALEKIDSSALREKIIYLPNNPSFFNTSLGNNLVYPETYRANLHAKKLETIAQKLGVKELIDQFPDRWETIIAEGGKNLSEGQKQIISLMRILAREYQIYLLDEFLSNVSSELKKKVLRAVFSQLKNKTVILISHDAETLAQADEIYQFTPSGLLKANIK